MAFFQTTRTNHQSDRGISRPNSPGDLYQCAASSSAEASSSFGREATGGTLRWHATDYATPPPFSGSTHRTVALGSPTRRSNSRPPAVGRVLLARNRKRTCPGTGEFGSWSPEADPKPTQPPSYLPADSVFHSTGGGELGASKNPIRIWVEQSLFALELSVLRPPRSVASKNGPRGPSPLDPMVRHWSGARWVAVTVL